MAGRDAPGLTSGSAYDAVVVGGGFFGCCLALALWKDMPRVVVLEKEAEPLLRASYRNQARVHGGYHYPRSITTALRSRVNYPDFQRIYADCIHDAFRMYYAVGRRFSNVTARQFEVFCERIEAPLARAPQGVRKLFNAELIEEVYEARECAFDADRLRMRLRAEMDARRLPLQCGAEAMRIFEDPGGSGRLAVEVRSACSGESVVITAGHVLVCIYSDLNYLLSRSGLPLIPLRQQLTEIALVELPAPLKAVGVTVMCGPFFSFMPFPARDLHSLSHVRYTPHADWREDDTHLPPEPRLIELDPPRSNFLKMRKDAERYLPLMRETRHVDSLWEVKALLPRNDENNGRPILMKRDHGLANLWCIIGGKLDNVFDVENELRSGRSPERHGAIR